MSNNEMLGRMAMTMHETENILIKFDNNIGTIVASSTELCKEKYVICDGHTICKNEYPELFALCNYSGASVKLPNYESIFNGKIHFYIICR
jgi:Phage Tail Collar Domain.